MLESIRCNIEPVYQGLACRSLNHVGTNDTTNTATTPIEPAVIGIHWHRNISADLYERLIHFHGSGWHPRFAAMTPQLVAWLGAGNFAGSASFSLANCMYFSAETFTSPGFENLTLVGSVRLLAGVEASNGLPLVGWSASFTYMSLERSWRSPAECADAGAGR